MNIKACHISVASSQIPVTVSLAFGGIPFHSINACWNQSKMVMYKQDSVVLRNRDYV